MSYFMRTDTQTDRQREGRTDGLSKFNSRSEGIRMSVGEREFQECKRINEKTWKKNKGNVHKLFTGISL
jgi:hypothetical protein